MLIQRKNSKFGKVCLTNDVCVQRLFIPNGRILTPFTHFWGSQRGGGFLTSFPGWLFSLRNWKGKALGTRLNLLVPVILAVLMQGSAWNMSQSWFWSKPRQTIITEKLIAYKLQKYIFQCCLYCNMTPGSQSITCIAWPLRPWEKICVYNLKQKWFVLVFL